MTRFSRIIGMVTLCSFLAGCSGYRQVSWRTPEQVSEEEESGDRGELQAGDMVRMKLVTDEKVEGRFISSDTYSIDILVGVPRDEQGESRTYLWNSIASIEKYDRWMALGANLAIVGVLILGAVAAQAVIKSVKSYGSFMG